MANTWLRLWHDMPNDPKWRTIARISNEPISLVLAVYLHLIVDASQNVTRGHVNVTIEDLASALDCDEEQINAILKAMQGRVLDGDEVTGWDKRQPKREDTGSPESGAKSASERKRMQRERDRLKANVTPSHEVSQNVTTDKDTDKDTDTEEIKHTQSISNVSGETTAASVCIAIKQVYDRNHIPPTDISQANPTLQALIKAGADVAEFRDSAVAAMQYNPPKGFAWILGRVKGQRKEAANIGPIRNGAMPAAIGSREAAIQTAAKSIFKPQHVQHLTGAKEIEVQDATKIIAA